MKKEIYVIGDIEMSRGDLSDDFISDKLISEFVISLSKKKGKVDLILNGDTFDFLTCPYKKGRKLTFPRHITEQISLVKLNEMIKAHSIFFTALKKFAQKHHVYFNIGNHDADLVFPKVQQRIMQRLGTKTNVHFGFSYVYRDVYVEHGHNYDYLNRTDVSKLFIYHRGKKILNLPWVSYVVLERMARIKRKYPFFERVHPRHSLFSAYKPLGARMYFSSAWAATKSFLTQFLYWWDQTQRSPYELLRHTFEKSKKIDWSLSYMVDSFKQTQLYKSRQFRIFVFGHVHEMFLEEKDGKAVMHPGALRDEYTLDTQTGVLVPWKKHYVHITFEEGKGSYEMKTFPFNRTPISFAYVRKDQLGMLHFAAKEEGFKMTYPPRKLRN